MQYRGKLAAVFAIATGFGFAAAPLVGQAAPQPRVYRLATVDGQPLPVTVEEEEGCREEVTAATLTLGDDGTWRLEVTERETCGDAVEEKTETEEGTYTAEGETLRFAEADDDADDPDDDAEDEDDDLDLDDFEVATLGADGLIVQLEGGRAAVFRPEAG